MLIIEIVILCTLFWGICYFNTGSDEKNIKNFSSYPNEVQNVIKENSILNKKIKNINPLVAFVSNILVFCVLLFIFGLFLKQANFLENFMNILILGQCLNMFDFLVIDMLWWRNTKRIIFTGTENMKNIYKNPRKHLISFLKGILVFIIVALIDGMILSFI